MNATVKVFVAALVACGVIALIAWESRHWANYALGSVLLAGIAAGVFALLRRVGRGREHHTFHPR
jgi:hypothetical protein